MKLGDVYGSAPYLEQLEHIHQSVTKQLHHSVSGLYWFYQVSKMHDVDYREALKKR